jgi:hypothetical protein
MLKNIEILAFADPEPRKWKKKLWIPHGLVDFPLGKSKPHLKKTHKKWAYLTTFHRGCLLDISKY